MRKKRFSGGRASSGPPPPSWEGIREKGLGSRRWLLRVTSRCRLLEKADWWTALFPPRPSYCRSPRFPSPHPHACGGEWAWPRCPTFASLTAMQRGFAAANKGGWGRGEGAVAILGGRGSWQCRALSPLPGCPPELPGASVAPREPLSRRMLPTTT